MKNVYDLSIAGKLIQREVDSSFSVPKIVLFIHSSRLQWPQRNLLWASLVQL